MPLLLTYSKLLQGRFGARPLACTKRVPGQVGNPGNKKSWLGEVDEKMPM